MQTEELLGLVSKIQSLQCELQNVEVKTAHQGCPTKLYDSLSSFSNQDGGGIIVFGLDEKQSFKDVGVYDVQDLQHKVAEQCKQMQPVVRPLFTVCNFNGSIIVSAEVPGVDIADRPVYYKGTGKNKGSFIRVGEADEPMSDYEIYSYDAYHRRVRDDIRVAELSDISQLDITLIDEFITGLKENKPNVAMLSDNEILELMGIIKEGKPTLAGVMCFSKYSQATFPQLCITAVVIPGVRMGETGADGERFLANKRIEGTIAQMLDEAVLFVKRNMRIKTIIDDNGKRNDKAEYPIKAIRESILNALIHRDYSIHTEGTPIRIEMYSDRIEIINAGGLYGRLTIDNLGKIHADTRNQTLTNILEILKVSENRYSGIPTIRLEMDRYHLPAPIFESKRGSFIVTLNNNITGKILQNHSSSIIKERSVEYFCKTPRTRNEISEFIGKTQYYTVKTVINPLVKKGVLKMTIPDKPKSRNQKYFYDKKGI